MFVNVDLKSIHNTHSTRAVHLRFIQFHAPSAGGSLVTSLRVRCAVTTEYSQLKRMILR